MQSSAALDCKFAPTPISRNSKRRKSLATISQTPDSLHLISQGSVTKYKANSTIACSSSSSTIRKPYSTIIGKTPMQVQRRNERERKRVQAVNRGYEVLAQRIADWEELKNRKLTKAQTLKAAILYIQHLEKLLRSGDSSEFSICSSMFSPSAFSFLDSSPDQPMEEENENDAEHFVSHQPSSSSCQINDHYSEQSPTFEYKPLVSIAEKSAMMMESFTINDNHMYYSQHQANVFQQSYDYVSSANRQCSSMNGMYQHS
ncbi:helix-loop-helix DNA-binding domain-containing protein [Ditylenchus destructor]|uniref:Helix-loop-helix DNA-binding domain-containing protein n=1 Tax=Ditylenchus destructor TaxID=166010 RepID=A0AAD4R9Q8_9BILA|nr:helix-loop-helix DNA-binding domain-containing protein [Ditylenchus destructor]